MHTSTSGGSSETDAKELAVMPCTFPGARSAVTTVTPVANWPRAWRNSRAVGGEVSIVEEFEDIIRPAHWRNSPETKRAAFKHNCGSFESQNGAKQWRGRLQ